MTTSRTSLSRDANVGSYREPSAITPSSFTSFPNHPLHTQQGWIIYARSCTVDQANGTSVEKQTTVCEHWLASLDYPILAVITDPGCPGSTMDRPGMRRLRELVIQGGVDGVVVVRLDRISRKLKDTLAFCDFLEAHGTQLGCVHDHLNNTIPADRFEFRLQPAFADSLGNIPS